MELEPSAAAETSSTAVATTTVLALHLLHHCRGGRLLLLSRRCGHGEVLLCKPTALAVHLLQVHCQRAVSVDGGLEAGEAYGAEDEEGRHVVHYPRQLRLLWDWSVAAVVLQCVHVGG